MDGGPRGRAQRDGDRARQRERGDDLGRGARGGGGGAHRHPCQRGPRRKRRHGQRVVDHPCQLRAERRHRWATLGAVRGQLGTWEDATSSTPDWLQVTFAAPATVDLIHVFSVQVNASAPVEPTPTLTSYIAAEDFAVQDWNGTAWVGVPGSQVVGNNLVWRPVAFAPITTTAIRIVVTKVYGNNTRLTEVEAWTPATTP